MTSWITAKERDCREEDGEPSGGQPSNLDSAAKPHQIRVFSRLREKPALKKKDLDNANSPKPAQDGGFAAESDSFS
jgi:hypothetical protein